MLAGERRIDASRVLIRCEVCGLSFLSEDEMQKHKELEHMKNKRPAGVR